MACIERSFVKVIRDIRLAPGRPSLSLCYIPGGAFEKNVPSATLGLSASTKILLEVVFHGEEGRLVQLCWGSEGN